MARKFPNVREHETIIKNSIIHLKRHNRKPESMVSGLPRRPQRRAGRFHEVLAEHQSRPFLTQQAAGRGKAAVAKGRFHGVGLRGQNAGEHEQGRRGAA